MTVAPAHVGECKRGRTAMNDALMSEEYEEGEETSGTSGSLTLDGEAWKNRGDTIYNSLLDINGVTDLFSQESTDQYNNMKQEAYTEQNELTEYLFSEQINTENVAGNVGDMIFSEEIRLSRNRDYSRNEEDYSICFVMAEIIFVLIFLYLLMKINAGRRKRREERAVEINVESGRAARYGSAGIR